MGGMGPDPIIPTNSQVALRFLRRKMVRATPLRKAIGHLGGIGSQKYEDSLKVCFETVKSKSNK